MISVEKGHIGEVDFPIEIAGCARIIGVVGRAALRKCAGSSKKNQGDENHAPPPGKEAAADRAQSVASDQG